PWTHREHDLTCGYVMGQDLAKVKCVRFWRKAAPGALNGGRGHSLKNGRTSIAWYRAIGCAAASLQVLSPGFALIHHCLIVERRRRRSAHPHDQQVRAGGAVLAACERGRLLTQPQPVHERPDLDRLEPGRR